jgi:transcriptional regulator with XRE-family HTH domain
MPRKNRFEIKDIERWSTFGKWIELQRDVVRLSQEEVAAAAGISTRQWIRYTKGAAVPQKRIQAIAKAIHVPLERVLKKAGYKSSDSGVDVNAYLQRITDSLIDDDLAGALYCLFQLHHLLEGRKRKQEFCLLTDPSNDFVRAAISFDRLPDWLQIEFYEYILAVIQGASKKDYPLESDIRENIRTMIKKELPKAMLMQGRITLDEMKTSSSKKESTEDG